MMLLKKMPVLQAFFETYFLDSAPENDVQVVRDFNATSTAEHRQQITAQMKLLLLDSEWALEEIGVETNRWFEDRNEAQAWIRQILGFLEGSQDTAVVFVKDSNGTLLNEGDSVHVIKDLKVKGGSSDLKRGTLIKKIHLIDDPHAIECRVDGSTLVLKTCFLKKN